VSLGQYKAKREFSRTPEPEGAVQESRGPLRFVVQKHHARRLHYDFRLEAGGVLKSWAVPRGPSLDPVDRRLAVMVEDHPIEYGEFEGVIPKGNYGAGTVMVWDAGVYGVVGAGTRAQTEKTVLDGLAKGRLKIVLQGQKLKGEFALFRTGRGDEKNWLIIKHRDSFASTQPVVEDDRSAKTGRTSEEIAGNPEYWLPNRNKAKVDLADAPETKMPRNIRPMLAVAKEEPFDDPNWIFEIKWDGYRAIAEIDSAKVRLYSRSQLSFEERYPPIIDSLKQLGHQAVLDGEIVVVDSAGKPRFQMLQNYGKAKEGTLVYFVFDLLYIDGHDLRGLPLSRRKEILGQILKVPSARLSEHVKEHGREFFRLAAEQGLEGIMAKDSRSPYLAGRRSDRWIKIKTKQQMQAVIAGFTEQRSNPRVIGALVLGEHVGADLTYIGHTGTGFSDRVLADLRRTLDPLVQPACPFKKKPKVNAPVHWVRPVLVCNVAFSVRTSDGILREPVFLGLRQNPISPGKQSVGAARSKHIEQASAPTRPLPKRSDAKLANGPTRIDGKLLTFTNLDKVYWPEDGYMKRDLVEYYLQISDFIVPYLKDRPLSLLRHPNGITGASFFQKDVSPQPPPQWVQTIMLRSDERDKEKKWIVCNDQATLAYLANLGCIEMNPWNSRIQSLDLADYLLLDLDPVEVSFSEVIRVAQEAHRILDQIGVIGFCKTSGKRGLHVYVPLADHLTHDQAKQFAQLLAHLILQRLPDLTSLVRDPAKRKGRVYPDFLQNGKEKTLAAAYSARPVPGAWVSTPLAWKEVKRGLDPSKFTIKTIGRRLERVGDLWSGVMGQGIDVQSCLEQLNGLLGTG
jgi:bifunctional non-homologous end joining protein LigD